MSLRAYGSVSDMSGPSGLFNFLLKIKTLVNETDVTFSHYSKRKKRRANKNAVLDRDGAYYSDSSDSLERIFEDIVDENTNQTADGHDGSTQV